MHSCECGHACGHVKVHAQAAHTGEQACSCGNVCTCMTMNVNAACIHMGVYAQAQPLASSLSDPSPAHRTVQFLRAAHTSA